MNGEYSGTIIYEDKNIRMENEVMLGFRKLDGIDLEVFKNKFNVSLEDIYNVNDLINAGYLVKENNHIRIKKEYMYISNEIIVRVLE